MRGFKNFRPLHESCGRCLGLASCVSSIADPNLTDASAWYLAAAPGVIPGIEMTYLNGKDTPTVESRVDFDVLGMETRIYMDFAVNVLDFRAFYKSTGK